MYAETIVSLVARLAEQLKVMYDAEESQRIARYAMEDLFGYLPDTSVLTPQQHNIWLSASAQLLQGVPLQYVTGIGWFYGKKFEVNRLVLIPRPETEELVDRASKYIMVSSVEGRIVDIGTGSGCIAIMMHLLTGKPTTGVDISVGALQVAQKNASMHNAYVEFVLGDMRQDYLWTNIEPVAHIISNPPYIASAEFLTLDRHVREHEPAVALFSPAGQSAMYYHMILLDRAASILPPGGSLWCEIHPDYANRIETYAVRKGVFQTKLHKDMTGRFRIMEALKL